MSTICSSLCLSVSVSLSVCLSIYIKQLRTSVDIPAPKEVKHSFKSK